MVTAAVKKVRTCARIEVPVCVCMCECTCVHTCVCVSVYCQVSSLYVCAC